MNMQPIAHSRSSSNGYIRRKNEKDTATRSDNKLRTGKTNPSRTGFGKGGKFESSSRDWLVYLSACFIGHEVEVQVSDGSIYSGIFHAINAEDFGIVVKMAYLIKDCSRGLNSTMDSSSKSHSRTLIVPDKDLVQVIAKGASLIRDESLNELQNERQQELMTDSCISQSRHVELGRELERWVPDENDPGCPELDNIFDGSWNRGWNQFEVNETLFGVKSTFNEDLYTTKLEKGPLMRELEREAARIAREIEGEETFDLHLAEERGIQLEGSLEIDEETRFSSVYRGVDDSGYNDIEDILLDTQNDETFGEGLVQSPAGSWDVHHSSMDGHHTRQPTKSKQLPIHSTTDAANRFHDNQFIEHADGGYNKEDKEKLKQAANIIEVPKSEDSHSLPRSKKESSDKIGLSPNATAFDPSHGPSKIQEKTSSSNELPEGALPPKAQGVTSSLARPSTASSTSDRGGATSTSAGRGLSPSSSVGSLSSEKSTLNPHAKEFKFNPNAKSFLPSHSPRPTSPVADSSFYYPANMAAITHMHGMPVGVGIGPSFGAQQPVLFNPQAAQVPQQYYHQHGPQYGQQMVIGQHRPVLYMPTHPSEMHYKGREY